MIKKILHIDNQISKNNNYLNNENYYTFIKVYEIQIFKIFEYLILNEKKITIFLNKEIVYISKFCLQYNEIIKNEKDYLIITLAVLFVKSFISNNLYDVDEGESITRKKSFNLFESNTIINSIMCDLNLFKIWLEIFLNENVILKNEIEFDNDRLRKGVLNFLSHMVVDKILSINKRWIKGKTYNYYTFEIENKNFIFINVFMEKFKTYEKNDKIYLYIDHFSTVFEVYKNNIWSGESFKLNKNSDFLKNVLEIKAKIDYESLKYFLDKKLNRLSYKEEELYGYYHALNNEIKKSIKQNDEESLAQFSKKLSEIMDLLRISEIIKKKNDIFFYFPIILCFRGRTYFRSSISFTFFKEFRSCLYTGHYKKDFKQQYHPLIKKIEQTLDKYIYKLDSIVKYDIKNKPIEIKRSIIWLTISCAEIFKKDMGDSIHIDTFIEYGIKILNNEFDISNLNEYDDLKIYTYKKIMMEIEKDIYIERLISKDATASCFQHLIKILGNEGEEALKWCNLSSVDRWYDTYTYILNLWKVEIKKELNAEEIVILEKYFTRANIKKATMTFQYGAAEWNALKEFRKIINAETLNLEDNKIINKLFKRYFNFIGGNLGILNKNSNEIVNQLKISNFKANFSDG